MSLSCSPMDGGVEKSIFLARSNHDRADVPEKQAWAWRRWRPEFVAWGSLRKQRNSLAWLLMMLSLTAVFSLWMKCGSFFAQDCITKLLFNTVICSVSKAQSRHISTVNATTGTRVISSRSYAQTDLSGSSTLICVPSCSIYVPAVAAWLN